ncbi:hypothetical protein AAC387_Pa03g4154 [Persea americana]
MLQSRLLKWVHKYEMDLVVEDGGMHLVVEDGGQSYEAGLGCGCICNSSGLSSRGSVRAMEGLSDEAAALVDRDRRYSLVRLGHGRRVEDRLAGRRRCRCCGEDVKGFSVFA